MDFEEIIKHHHSDATGFSRHYMLLYSIILGMESKKVFEFGSGISTRVILKAMERTGGKLITCDKRSIAETGNSAELLEKNKHRWQYVQAESRSAIPEISETGFDVVLHDGAHDYATVKRDIKNILPKMKKGAILLVHDTKHPTRYGQSMIRAVRSALRWHRKEILTLPYGYGLTIVRIKSDYGNGQVSTKWRKIKNK